MIEHYKIIVAVARELFELMGLRKGILRFRQLKPPDKYERQDAGLYQKSISMSHDVFLSRLRY